MRRLETATREQKRIRDIAKAEGDNVLVKRCNERIKAYRVKYDDIAKKAGITPDYKRMSVPKGNQFNPSSEKGISSKRKFLTEENKVNIEYIFSKEYKENLTCRTMIVLKIRYMNNQKPF